jgi:hypothetical protein
MEYERNSADARVDHIRGNAVETEQRLKEKYSDNLELMKKNQEQQLNDLRVAMTKDKNEALAQLRSQAQEKEVGHQQQVEDIVSKYEKRIAELNDQFVREKRARDLREKQVVEGLKKSADQQIEALKVQYEEKNKQTTVAHQTEIREVSRRHKEQIDNIMSNAKKS